MKNRRLRPVIPALLLSIVFAVGCENNGRDSSVDDLRQRTQNTPAVVEVSPEPKMEWPAMSVPGMRMREYSSGNITLLDPVPAEEGLFAREFSYDSDRYRVYGLIERPAGDPPEGGWPVILLAHGYIPPELYSTTRNYRSVSQYYARGGFMVVKPDFREHGRSEGRSDMTASWIFDYTADTLNLLDGIKGIPGTDPDNVFLYGHSMGGEIALRVMMINQDILKGSSLWAAMSEDFPDNLMFYIGTTPDSRAAYQAVLDAEISRDDYEALSLSPFIHSIETPMIIHQGTEDVEVPLEWSRNLVRLLDTVEAVYLYYEYPGEDHNLSGSYYRVLDADMDFFRSLM